jgi:toxin ParE1/3/4
MKVIIRESAEDDIDHIFASIGKDNVVAATAMVARIREAVVRLELDALTQIGRPGLLQGTRELVERPFIIVYRVNDPQKEIEILAIFHRAQNRSREEN